MTEPFLYIPSHLHHLEEQYTGARQRRNTRMPINVSMYNLSFNRDAHLYLGKACGGLQDSNSPLLSR